MSPTAGIKTKIGCHSLRGTGNHGVPHQRRPLDAAQRMAIPTCAATKLYDRRGDQVSLDDVERISF
jgi:hypothetical protein